MGICLFCLVVLCHQKIYIIQMKQKKVHDIQKNFQFQNEVESTQSKYVGLCPQKIIEK